jgi:hypothetical protein
MFARNATEGISGRTATAHVSCLEMFERNADVNVSVINAFKDECVNEESVVVSVKDASLDAFEKMSERNACRNVCVRIASKDVAVRIACKMRLPLQECN